MLYPIGRQQKVCCRGFTVLELVVVTAIVATLVGIAIPVLSSQIGKARIARAMTEIRMLERAIKAYEVAEESLPDSLSDTGQANLLDPWGNSYQYLKIAGDTTGIMGKVRKDRFQVPVNTDYDLYSMGEDGKSKPPFTAKSSRDDIVRCNDGGYVGLASEF